MNYLYLQVVVLSFSLAIIGGWALSEAQVQPEIEPFTIAEKTQTFQRFQFQALILASDIGDGNQFISDIERERIKYVLKNLPTKTSVRLWCDSEQFGKIFMVEGAYVFKHEVDADKVRQWLKNNLPLDKIRYGNYYLTNNNHHWDNPLPDDVIEFREYKTTKENLEVILPDCF